MKLLDRKVDAPLSGLAPAHLGTPTAVQPGVDGLTRRSQRDFGAGGPNRGRVVTLPMCLQVAAGLYAHRCPT
jgi:hypothetical protein